MSYLKKIFVLLFACMMLLPAYTEARVPVFTSDLGGNAISCSIYSDQASLGGIHPGDSLQMVRSVLGDPISVSTPNSMTLKYYYRGLTINLIDWGNDGNFTVNNLETSYKSSTFATMDGVKVGDPESVLTTIYGMADSVISTRIESPKITLEQQDKLQSKFNKTVYRYNANETIAMAFIVQNGVIDQIEIHQSE